MKNILIKILLLFFILGTTTFSSDTIKITIIERITHFIQWPELQDKFYIGIYKDEKLKEQMIDAYNNKKIQKLPIEVFDIKNPDDNRINSLNLLYFTKESSKDVDKLFKRIEDKPILIITEHPNDVYTGMHLGLYYKNKRIKFIINKDSLEKAKLKASYKILKLAKIVKKESIDE